MDEHAMTWIKRVIALARTYDGMDEVDDVSDFVYSVVGISIFPEEMTVEHAAATVATSLLQP